jgi:hypothetical protein
MSSALRSLVMVLLSRTFNTMAASLQEQEELRRPDGSRALTGPNDVVSAVIDAPETTEIGILTCRSCDRDFVSPFFSLFFSEPASRPRTSSVLGPVSA